MSWSVSHPEVQSMQKASRRSTRTIERLRFTFTPNGKREFVPRDQVFPLFSVYCLLLLHKISSFTPALSIRIALDCFYLLIFYSEKFSTDVCRLPYAVNVNLNLSIFAISTPIVKGASWNLRDLTSHRQGVFDKKRKKLNSNCARQILANSE